MTAVLITVDTELSPLLHQRGAGADANFAASITGTTRSGDFGIGWQMDVLERHGLTGVFFVDPAPTLVHGDVIIRRIVAPIVARGHEVQLHIHSEWLEWATHPPVVARGTHIGDFSRDDQRALLAWARDTLVRCGAPPPTAFRAGNYGANDDTLLVLAELGLRWDSSFNPAYAPEPCRIGLPRDTGPACHCGLIELPVSAIHDRPGRVRAAQVCALSEAEMCAALRHAGKSGASAFVIVTHSFEMLSRDRQRPNRAVMRRFTGMCAEIGANPALKSSGFRNLDEAAILSSTTSRLHPSTLRTAARIAEQALATWRYERRLLPQ